MNLFEPELVRVLMGVPGSVGVGVRVFVRDVFVLVGGVCVYVRDVAVPVFMRMRRVMAVLFAHASFSSVCGTSPAGPSGCLTLIALICR